MKANFCRRLRIIKIALCGIKDHFTKFFPSVALREYSLADGPSAESAILFLCYFEDEFSHVSSLRLLKGLFKSYGKHFTA